MYQKEINNLNNKITNFKQACSNQNMSEKLAYPYIDEIILAAIKVYKNKDIKLLIPEYDNGVQAIYQEDDRLYISVYSDEKLLRKSGLHKYRTMSLKDICSVVYENLTIYDLYNNIDAIANSDYSYEEVINYVKSKPKLSGIMYNPCTDYIFGFEGYSFNALMFKGMGVHVFRQINPDTNEVIHEI